MKVSIANYKVRAEYPVHWGEMDAAKHINNLVYLRWAESGRLQYFEAIGMDIAFEKVGPILGWQDCKYIFPITYPDTAIIGVRTLEIKEDRLILESAIFSKKHQRIAAIAKQSIIPYDYAKLEKATLPEHWIVGIQKLES